MYTGTIDVNDFKDFLYKVFRITNPDCISHEHAQSIVQMISQLRNIKAAFKDISYIDKVSITVPQLDIDEEMNNNYNIFSSSYQPIEVFENAPLAIYFPLINITVLFRYIDGRDTSTGLSYEIYDGFILRDSTPAIPRMDTNIYFYNLSCAKMGPVLYKYIDTRYHIYNLTDGYKYEFKHGFNQRILDLTMEMKIYFYQAVLKSMIEEIYEYSNIKFYQ